MLSEATILIMIFVVFLIGLKWQYGVWFVIAVTFAPVVVSFLFEAWADRRS